MPGAVRTAGRRTANTSTRSLTRAPSGRGTSRRPVPAASRYEANRRTRTQICRSDVISGTWPSIGLIQRWHWASSTRCQKIEARGVLSVNGDNTRDLSVLKVEEQLPIVGGTPPARFEALFSHFYPELYGLVYRVLGDRMESEDTLQDTFLKLADDARLQARPDAEIGAWLRRV